MAVTHRYLFIIGYGSHGVFLDSFLDATVTKELMAQVAAAKMEGEEDPKEARDLAINIRGIELRARFAHGDNRLYQVTSSTPTTRDELERILRYKQSKGELREWLIKARVQ